MEKDKALHFGSRVVHHGTFVRRVHDTYVR